MHPIYRRGGEANMLICGLRGGWRAFISFTGTVDGFLRMDYHHKEACQAETAGTANEPSRGLLIQTDESAFWKSLETYSVDDAYVTKSVGDQIVATAMKYLGVPYVWGGTTPYGFDCSGLVQYVYAENGISISRTTYTQQAKATPVSFDDLQPGDLVFWGYSAYHVGIYIGNGQYIHAPAPGQSVCIQSYSAYPFTSAGRIVG